MIVLTVADELHERFHEVLLPDGPIPHDWFPTSSIDGHFHGVWIEEDLEVGETVEIVTDLSLGEVGLQRHAHTILVTATEAEPDEVLEGEGTPDAGAAEGDGIHLDEPEEERRDRCGLRLEVKTARSAVVEVKQATRNGVSVGTLAGYMSTWEPDTGGRFGVPDKFEPGAWLESLAEHRARGMRQVRLKDHHGRTIGGFPIETVREDERGLFGIAEVNLEMQEGREAFSLARQGVLTDFSVGYVALDDKLEPGVRRISRAMLFESSIVDEPGNQGANITEVKAVQAALAAVSGFVDVEAAKALTARDLEAKLMSCGAFSRAASRYLAAKIGTKEVAVEPELEPEPEPSVAVRYDEKELSLILQGLKEAKATLLE